MHQYQIRIQLGTLDALGRQLYSNVAAVIAELIANAWDAEATEVSVTYQPGEGHGSLIISDNGCGMSVAELNERFLTIGYRKRQNEGDTSPRFGRPFMGRKGIGKLSVFSIANSLTVISRKDGSTQGFKIDGQALNTHAESGSNDPFYPLVLTDTQLGKYGQDMPETGTRIILDDLTKPFDGRTIKPLRTRIARRFDVFSLPEEADHAHQFAVIINNEPITYADREDIQRCEFIWLLGDYQLNEHPTDAKVIPIEDSTVVSSDGSTIGDIRGWIGSVRKPADLSLPDTDESLGDLIVLARRRPIQEGILNQIQVPQLFVHYATGQISADFLDIDGQPDLATTDRQRLIEDDPRVQAFYRKLNDIIADISAQWSKERIGARQEKLTSNYPSVTKWLAHLPPKEHAIATKLITSVHRAEKIKEDERRSLYQGVIMAFERLQAHGALSRLAHLEEITPSDVLTMLTKYNEHEALQYGRIVRDRIAVIEQLDALRNAHAIENEVRNYVAEHPWLLNPAWERATQDKSVEKTFKKLAKEHKVDLDSPGGNNRVDLAFINSGRTYSPLIIEFKRPDLTISLSDITTQLRKYAAVMTETLEKMPNAPGFYTNEAKFNPHIRMAVIAEAIKDEMGNKMKPNEVSASIGGLNVEVFYYDTMAATALDRYRSFLELHDQVAPDYVSEALKALDQPTA